MVDIRELPGVIEAVNDALSRGEVVELKIERQIPKDKDSPLRLLVIGISRKIRHFGKLK